MSDEERDDESFMDEGLGQGIRELMLNAQHLEIKRGEDGRFRLILDSCEKSAAWSIDDVVTAYRRGQ